jgi:hypothetical protein
MDQPFSLKHLFSVVGCDHVSPQESTTSHSSANARAVSAQSSSSRCARIQKWASEHRKTLSSAEFSARLDGAQVGGELMDIFRETPEFGRSLAMRLAAFHEERSIGTWRLIAGGGEATVFADDANQQVIKLFAPPCKARFGWILRMKKGQPIGI